MRAPLPVTELASSEEVAQATAKFHSLDFQRWAPVDVALIGALLPLVCTELDGFPAALAKAEAAGYTVAGYKLRLASRPKLANVARVLREDIEPAILAAGNAAAAAGSHRASTSKLDGAALTS